MIISWNCLGMLYNPDVKNQPSPQVGYKSKKKAFHGHHLKNVSVLSLLTRDLAHFSSINKSWHYFYG
jgi:hypothetical protein